MNPKMTPDARNAAPPIEPITQATEITRLLSACDLPVTDIAPCETMAFFGCRSSGELIGLIGLELYGDNALLRSLAVAAPYRNSGLGKALVKFAEMRATALGVTSLFLLTTTAAKYFRRLGYESTPREQAPSSIRDTRQFSGLCPSSSAFMNKHLAPCRDGRS